MTIIKYCDIDIIKDGCISHYLELLPAFMGEEIMRYRYAADQKARLLSRLMLRESIDETGDDACLNDWKRDVHNKPVIAKWKAFNIAHASNLVVFAYTTGELIGIDIENKKRDLEYREIMTHFHEEEQAFIASSSDPIDSFYKIWTKKEAVLKAVGVGIVNGLNDFSCVRDFVDYAERSWSLKEVAIHEDYACYLCLLDLGESVSVAEFKMNCEYMTVPALNTIQALSK